MVAGSMLIDIKRNIVILLGKRMNVFQNDVCVITLAYDTCAHIWI